MTNLKQLEQLKQLLNCDHLKDDWNQSYGITKNRNDSLTKQKEQGNRLSNNSKLKEKERQIELQIKKEGKFLPSKAIVRQPRKSNKDSLYKSDSETALTLFLLGNIGGWKQIETLKTLPRYNNSHWSKTFFGNIRESPQKDNYESLPSRDALWAALWAHNKERKEKIFVCKADDLQKSILLFEFEILNTAFHPRYLFSWDSVPGNDSENLIRFLGDEFDISWANDAEISKSDDDITICISKDENSAEITIDEQKGKAILKINDGRTSNLKVKTENDKLNIYDSSSISKPKPFKELSFVDLSDLKKWSQFDAVLIVPGEKLFVFFEAKLTSDRTEKTKKYPKIDQIMRNLESAFLLTNHKDSLYKDWKFKYVLICPRESSQGKRYNDVFDSSEKYISENKEIIEKEYKSSINKGCYSKYFESFERQIPNCIYRIYWDELGKVLKDKDENFFHNYLNDLDKADFLKKDIDNIKDRFKRAEIDVSYYGP